MKIILDWLDTFGDLKTPYVGDESVFELNITHAENKFAIATVIIKKPKSKSFEFMKKGFARISMSKPNSKDFIPIFCGYISSLPLKIEENFIKLELISRKEDVENQVKEIKKSLIGTVAVDELFVPEGHEDNPTCLLEAISGVFNFDRVTGKVNISDINFGSKQVSINEIATNHITMKRCGMPLDSVRIKLKTDWLQQCSGIYDFSSFIPKLFGDILVRTFTGDDFAYRIKNLSHVFKSNSYEVIFSDVEEVIYERNVFNAHKNSSGKILVKEDGKDKFVEFEKTSFDIFLLLYWNYRQKRSETLNLEIKNSFQKSNETSPNIKNLNINLRPITYDEGIPEWHGYTFYECKNKVRYAGKVYSCIESHNSRKSFYVDKNNWQFEYNLPHALGNQAFGSFFNIVRGQKALLHAAMMARAHLAWSTRCIEITFRTSVDYFPKIDLDTTVKLEWGHLQNGQILGKVVFLKLIADGKSGKQYLDVTIACSIGLKDLKDCSPLDMKGYTLENYCSSGCFHDDVVSYGGELRVSDLVFDDFTINHHIPGIACPSLMNEYTFVENSKLINSPEEQRALLIEYARNHQDKKKLVELLNKNKTQFVLELRDLQQSIRLKHEINITAKLPWQAPMGIKVMS